MPHQDQDNPSSQRDRRLRHHKVASETEEQLRKLVEIAMQKKEIEESVTPREDSSSATNINLDDGEVVTPTAQNQQYDLAQRMVTLQEDSDEDSCENYDLENNVKF